MVVGQEAVGKTTLVNALQGKFIVPVSTNGVDIAEVKLSRRTSFLSRMIGYIEQEVTFSVWDFGGQSVFHSTHRFFITPFALYVVVYDMRKPETRERVKYD